MRRVAQVSRVPKISGNQSWVAIDPWYTRSREGLRRMVPGGGDVGEVRRCQRRYRTVSEYPHAVGERLVNIISVIVLEPARNLSEERCHACPGRRGTAVSCGKARVERAPSRAFGPLTSRQDQ